MNCALNCFFVNIRSAPSEKNYSTKVSTSSISILALLKKNAKRLGSAMLGGHSAFEQGGDTGRQHSRRMLLQGRSGSGLYKD